MHPMSLRILIVGHGRMGQLVEVAGAAATTPTIAGIVDEANAATLADRDRWRDVDVAIEFSHADAFLANLPALTALGAQPRRRHDRLAGAGRTRCAAPSSGPASGRWSPRTSRSGANLLDALAETRRPPVPAACRLRRVHPRVAPRGQARRAVGDGAGAQGRARARRPDPAPSTSRRPAPASSPASTPSASTVPARPSPSATPSAIAPPSPTAPSSPPAGCGDAGDGLRCSTYLGLPRPGGLSENSSCEHLLPVAARRSSRRSPPTAASTSLRFDAWRDARWTAAFISSCPAAPPARARRSRPTNAAASSSSSSRKPAGRAPVLAGAGGYDTREVIESVAMMARGRRAGHPLGHALLQQAHPGRPVPALPRDCREHVAPDRGLQRARPHRLQRRARDARPSRRHPQHRRRQGSVGEHRCRSARCAASCPSTSSC